MISKKHLIAVGTLVLASTAWMSCANIGSMQKRMAELSPKVTPDPLEVHGDSIQVSISGKFPEKYFAKKVAVEATPVLVYSSNEVKFKSKSFKGEKATGNGDVVAYATGKSFSYTDKIAYSPAMSTSELQLRIVGSQGSKSKELPAIKLANGVISTSKLVKSDEKVMSSKDNFVRSSSGSFEAVVNFDYNSDKVNAKELTDADIAAMVEFLSTTLPANTRMKITNIELQSYASPEGEIFLNNDLATGRAEAGKTVLMDLLKKNKLDAQYASMIQLVPKGEDWVGFKEAMDKSSIEDRDLIIRILQRTSDLQAREQEIKNISKTYSEISEKIFPGLRRCIIRVNYTVEGFSDQELKSMVSNPSSLKYEECLRAASLVDDLTVKANAYKAAQGMSGADYRATNNLGVVYYNQGNMNGAAQEFEKAYGMKKNSETSNNQGVMTRLNGDKKKAAGMYSESGSAEAQYNTGIMQIMAGNYGSAIASMGNYKSFNTALAKCLNKDYNGAKSDMESSNDNTAMGFYLRAIIAARLNDANGVKDNLAKAIEKDGKLAEKSKSDLEFRNFQGK